MHQSRVYALLIDAPEAEAGSAAAFWSAALGAVPVARWLECRVLRDRVPSPLVRRAPVAV